jgi:hypothetical protein
MVAGHYVIKYGKTEALLRFKKLKRLERSAAIGRLEHLERLELTSLR